MAAKDGRVTGATLIVEKPESPEERTRGVLTVMAGAEAGRVVPLPEIGMVSMGRSPDCELKFDDASVSGTHAQIARVGGVYVFVDSRSTNGSYVNEARVQTPVQLKDGDRIRLGSNSVLRFSLMNTEEQAALQRIYEAALRDGLTGVYNRKHLEERLDIELSFANRHKAPLSIVMVDVDFFKKVNDTYGHPGGDEVLRRTAATLGKSLRAEDIVARYGGEEFTVVARGTDLAQAGFLAERLRKMVEAQVILFAGQQIRVTISMGVASLACCGEQHDKATLFAIADRRLYIAKQSGRNRVINAG